MTTPSGKQNSHSSHCEACGILVEIKDTKVPTSYANAFAEPVERIGKPDDDGPDEKSIEGRSVACLGDHVQSVCSAYGIESRRFWYSPKLWRFPLRYWDRTEEGKKNEAKEVVAQRFCVLEGKGKPECKPEGLVEAVINGLGRNLKWAEVKDLGKASTKEA